MPDTALYLYLGLAAIACILLAFIAGMLLRRRNLEQDHALLDQVERGE